MSSRFAAALLFLSCSCLTVRGVAAEPAWLTAMGAAGRRDALRAIRAEAHVRVSDGLEYDVVTLFLDHQHAIFHRTYADRTIALSIEGKYTSSYDGEKESEGSPALESIVLGHQFHAQILYFDVLHGPMAEPVEVDCDGRRCVSIAGADGNAIVLDSDTSRPVKIVLVRDDAPPIEIGFDGWREVDEIALPFLVTIHDGTRTFRFEFVSVRFEGSMDELRAPFDRLTDEQKLIRLHRVAMDAHLLGDASMMRGSFAPRVTIVGEGAIDHATVEESEAMMARRLSNRRHRVYDDLVRPEVKVSGDGSLGWVIARVRANGVRLDENGRESGPLDFTSGWISMFEKLDGEWKQTGNVSTFAPGSQ